MTTAARRRAPRDETGRYAVIYPAIAEAARRLGADAVGLVDVGRSAGFNLQVDRVGIAYRKRDRTTMTLGDPASPVRVSAALVGGRPVPTGAIPSVVARVLLAVDPLDVTDDADARWLRAGPPPDRPEGAARLDAELALAAGAPPRLVRGDVVDRLPDAVAQVPDGALPVVLTTWTLSRLRPARRGRFLDRLGAAAAGRASAWVAVEGVGVAPGVPTLGDRPASGHSIIGLTTLDGSARRTEALGRCWSRGRYLAWLPTAPGNSERIA